MTLTVTLFPGLMLMIQKKQNLLPVLTTSLLDFLKRQVQGFPSFFHRRHLYRGSNLILGP